MHPMHSVLLTNAAAEIFVAIHSQHRGSEAQSLEQAARLTAALDKAAMRSFKPNGFFPHPMETLGLVKSAATLLASKIAAQPKLDASQEEALVAESIQQAQSLTKAVVAAHKNQRKASRDRPGQGPELPPGVRIEEGEVSFSPARPRPGR